MQGIDGSAERKGETFMKADLHEIAPDVFRISVFAPDFDLEFNHFLVRDDDPLLYHAGMRGMFPVVREAVARVLDPSRLRWIGFSHFEVDECGALNDWLGIAPRAQALCGVVGAMVNLGDFADRPPRALDRGETVVTGRHRFRYRPTPHLPHGWDAGMLFEETRGTLFCSDLFHQSGQREPLTEGDLLDRTRRALEETRKGPLMDYMPYTPYTERLLGELASLRPTTLAVMHGSSFRGDGERALRDLAPLLREIFGPPGSPPA
jgi:flavorubredoxin